MNPYVIRFGIFAGLIVAVPMLAWFLTLPADAGDAGGVVQGYIVMLLALSMIFIGTRQYRDRALGGVIRFAPALLVGLGISAVAGLFYVVAWEVSLAFGKFDFVAFYSNSMIEKARAAGASPEVIAAETVKAAEFTRMYANPLFRVPMTFLEIFPIGVLVSLISAALLRNSRFLPARVN